MADDADVCFAEECGSGDELYTRDEYGLTESFCNSLCDSKCSGSYVKCMCTGCVHFHVSMSPNCSCHNCNPWASIQFETVTLNRKACFICLIKKVHAGRRQFATAFSCWGVIMDQTQGHCLQMVPLCGASCTRFVDENIGCVYNKRWIFQGTTVVPRLCFDGQHYYRN